MPELDVLRGIAVLGVFFFHGFRAQYPNVHFAGLRKILVLTTQAGALGVNLFFVLSGFLITGILLDSRHRPDYYRRFYVRRALRILPAYYSLLLILGLLRQSSAAFLGLSFIYLSNLAAMFGVVMGYHPLWSLAVEEHYYILWPSVVRKLRCRYLAAFSLAICILTPISRAVCFHHGYLQGREWQTWFAADGLAAGSLLALALRTTIRRERAASGGLFLLAASAILLVAGLPFGIMSRDTLLGASLQLTLVNAVFAAVLVIFLLLGSGPHGELVGSPTLQFFGYISYGLYLIHPLLFRLYDQYLHALSPSLSPSRSYDRFELVVLRFAVVSVIAIVVSYLSRKYYEEWFLRLKESAASGPPALPAEVL